MIALYRAKAVQKQVWLDDENAATGDVHGTYAEGRGISGIFALPVHPESPKPYHGYRQTCRLYACGSSCPDCLVSVGWFVRNSNNIDVFNQMSRPEILGIKPHVPESPRIK